jgi:Ran GTPase-activating protein (RanGAP) involved in mRNA processing and transport
MQRFRHLFGRLAAASRRSISAFPSCSDNAVNPQGAIKLEPLISGCLTIKTLILNNTGVGPAGGVVGDCAVQATARARRSIATRILLLRAVSLAQTIGKALQAAQALGVQRKTPYALERFILGRSRLEDPGCMEISKAFAVSWPPLLKWQPGAERWPPPCWKNVTNPAPNCRALAR